MAGTIANRLYREERDEFLEKNETYVLSSIEELVKLLKKKSNKKITVFRLIGWVVLLMLPIVILVSLFTFTFLLCIWWIIRDGIF